MSDYFGAEIAQQAIERPTAPAVLTPYATIDFRTFHRWIEGIAGALIDAGVTPGTVVAFVLRNRARDLAALMALQRLGAPVLVLDADEPAALRNALSARAGARVTVADASDGNGSDLPVLSPTREWLAHPPAAVPPPPPDRISYMTRSSGTTGGISKLVPTDHGWEVRRIRSTYLHFPIEATDRYLTMMRFSFGIARDHAIRTLLRGGAVILPPPLRSAAVLLAAARDHGATWTSATPIHLRELLAVEGPHPLLPEVRVIASAAMLTPAERVKVMQRITPKLYIVYGTNEVGVISVANPADLGIDIASVGRLDAGIEGEAVDDDDRSLPRGQVGTLRFRHPRFALAYLDPPPGASSRFVGEWFYPGDAGLIDAEGRVQLRGRVDDAINVSGIKVHPGDIEACLAAHPAVGDVAAFGYPSRRLGMVPFAMVVADHLTGEATLVDHCRSRLGAAATPARILLVDAIPRTTNGKFDRRSLARHARTILGAGGA